MTDKNTQPESPLGDIEGFLRRFVAFSNEAHAKVLSLWILHTWAFDASYATPYIYVSSAEKQSGKTRLIEVLALIARNPLVAAQATSASIFRVIEDQRPTLFLDEADAIWSGSTNEELRGMLNSGYKHNGTVTRVIPGKDGGETKQFSTYSPKLLAGIDNGRLPDTIADRCIRIELKRKKKDQEVERLIERKVQPDADALKVKIEAWVRANMDKIITVEPPVIDEISDRAFEIAEPLLQIAGRIRGASKPAREALTELLKKDEAPLSLPAQTLLAAKNIMDETGQDKVSSAALAEAMDVSTKRIGILLAPFGITPRSVRWGTVTAKGYHRKDFEDAWERYL